jgi:hypothetical protein
MEVQLHVFFTSAFQGSSQYPLNRQLCGISSWCEDVSGSGGTAPFILYLGVQRKPPMSTEHTAVWNPELV